MEWRRLMAPALDALYPRKCGLCGLFSPVSICALCRADFRTFEPDRDAMDCLSYRNALYAYHGRAAQAVRRLKYERVTSLAAPMADDLAAFLAEEVSFGFDRVVPIPIHWSRRCHRGFNQSELLCESLERSIVAPRLLRRIKATRPQVGLSPSERATNLTGAFAASAGAAGQSILLVDDVATSGHTAEECARTLLAAGARSVGVVTFAGG